MLTFATSQTAKTLAASRDSMGQPDGPTTAGDVLD